MPDKDYNSVVATRKYNLTFQNVNDDCASIDAAVDSHPRQLQFLVDGFCKEVAWTKYTAEN